MQQQSPLYSQDVEQCVQEIINRVGKRIVLGIPLGIGKPNPLVNALYRRAKADPELRLRILTAITVETPKGSSDLEKRFLEPFVERVFGNYPDLEYAVDLRTGRLPPNVEIAEFFFKPGGFLNVPMQQQNYISTNYTHAARDLMDNGLNVVAQLVAARDVDGEPWFSLGSNPDVTLDLLAMIGEARRRGRPMVTVAQVNREMPFMYHDAMLRPAAFDLALDNPVYDFRLFGPPNMPVDNADYLLGLQASALIRDGGTLQIGLTLAAATQAGDGEEWLSQTWGFAKLIMPLLLGGVLLAGFLLGRPGHEGIIPSEWVGAAVGGNSLAANFLSALVGAFMYFATLTEVPIVQGLIGAGMGQGPALALLLAGPALSLPNMLVIRGILGTQKTVVYCSLVVVMATLTGWVFGTFYP